MSKLIILISCLSLFFNTRMDLNPDRNYYASKNLKYLSKLVESEAAGEDIYGKIAVAQVVLNRCGRDDRCSFW